MNLRVLAVALAALAVTPLLADTGSWGFDAALVGPGRASQAAVVANTTAYAGVQPRPFGALVAVGYTNQTAVNVTNLGSVPTTYVWTTTADPNATVTSVGQCAAPTPVGGTCRISFTGPGKLAGRYNVTGTIDATGTAGFRAALRGVVVRVTYCVSACDPAVL